MSLITKFSKLNGSTSKVSNLNVVSKVEELGYKLQSLEQLIESIYSTYQEISNKFIQVCEELDNEPSNMESKTHELKVNKQHTPSNLITFLK